MRPSKFDFAKKQEIFIKIIQELKDSQALSVSSKELLRKFKKYGYSLQTKDYTSLEVRNMLLAQDIHSGRVLPVDKIKYMQKLIEYLKENNITVISNDELIEVMKEQFDVSLSQNNISALGFRDMLLENGIESKYDVSSKQPIIEKMITFIKENKIEIKSIADLHKYAVAQGKISRGTIDNNIDYISSKIDISHLPSTKKLEALNMSDDEIVIKTAKYYIKRNVYKITASEFKAHTHQYYRTINIEVIKSFSEFLHATYDIKIVTQGDGKEDSINQDLNKMKSFLKEYKLKYEVTEAITLDNIDYIKDNTFIISTSLHIKLSDLWKIYIENYIKWLAPERINVKNSFIDSANNLCINTDKKKFITLSHTEFKIEDMTFIDLIKLTLLKNRASDKAYGIHMQNMYIGFLLFLHSENKVILPFSYVYDVCFTDKKAQVELPHYLSENIINLELLSAIKENRLNVKDNKYKRIFQFFLLSISTFTPISKIKYEHLTPLLVRNKKDFKRVKEILNTLGADIVDDVPDLKYVERYIKYAGIEKYADLIQLFNKAMNRTVKLGEYAKDKNLYTSWSSSYADFLDFLEENYSNDNIHESFLYKVFDYPDEEKILTYQEYVQNLRLSGGTKDKRFTPLIIAFSDQKYRSLNNLKDKKPTFDNTSDNKDTMKKRGAITNPIALEKIEDILRHRPPKSDYFKSLIIDSKYTDWWKNYSTVAPFEPLILLMHLYIPARGINFRLADRNTFLVKNNQGKTTGYHFTHDKNKKRKQPYIAPNIWGDDLQIIEDFIDYSEVHFKNIKPIKYDKQNIQGILPLFPNAKGTSFYTESQHMKYWKRVLLKAQIELNNEKMSEEIILIYVNDVGIVFPKNSIQVDELSQHDMEKFTLRYDLHSLRHTGATKYANAGMPLSLLKLLTGHIDLNVLQSVYIEVDTERLIAVWTSLQNTDIGGFTLAEAGSELIGNVKKDIKSQLLENNSQELLAYLKKEIFISIGAYTEGNNLIKYTLEDFSKIDPIYWNFNNRNGICTSATCPQGLENRCSLCPHFITSPMYIYEISNQINLQNARVSKYINIIIENRKNGNPALNESIRKSAQVELEDMLGWVELLKALDEKIVDDQPVNNKSSSSSLVAENNKITPIYHRAAIQNNDHALLKLVYDSLELKKLNHESMSDATEQLVSKLTRYAARKGLFQEIDGKDKYELFEWFKPVYNRVLSLEKNETSNEELLGILMSLSDSNGQKCLAQNTIKELRHKDPK